MVALPNPSFEPKTHRWRPGAGTPSREVPTQNRALCAPKQPFLAKNCLRVSQMINRMSCGQARHFQSVAAINCKVVHLKQGMPLQSWVFEVSKNETFRAHSS